MALVADPDQGDSPAEGAIGAVRALQRLRQQFDVVPGDGPLERYKVVVVPEGIPVGPALAGRLADYVGGGGALLISAVSDGEAGPRQTLLRSLGVEVTGTWPFDPVFLGLSAPGLLAPAPGLDIQVPGTSARLEALAGTQSWWTWSCLTSNAAMTISAGTVTRPRPRAPGHGAVLQSGQVIVLAVPLFCAVATEASSQYVELLGACLSRLLPRPVLRAGGPAHLETAVVHTERHDAVHLLSFIPSPLGRDFYVVLDPVPVVACPIWLRTDVAPSRAVLQPGGESQLPLRYLDGYAATEATVLGGHGLVVFER